MAEGLGNPALYNLPTPNLADRIIAVRKDPNVSNYAIPEPGALYEGTGVKGGNAEKYAGFLFTTMQLDPRSGEHIWFFVNERANQDLYNFETTYAHEAPDYPIRVRTYVILRGAYEALPLATEDPLTPELQLISQEQVRVNDPVIDSLFVVVRRAYGVLPGPVLNGQRINERGDLETVSSQDVEAGTATAADGLLVTQSQVQATDAGKSVKVVATVPSHSTLTSRAKGSAQLIPPKFLAAAETSTVDDIVAPSASPDTPTGNLVESRVEQQTKTKARRVNTTLDLSVTPSVPSTRINERGDKEAITESLVDDTVQATDSILTTQSSVEGLGNGKAVKSVAVVAAHTLLISKIRNERGDEVAVRDEIVAPGTAPLAVSVFVEDSKVEALSATKSRKVTSTTEGPSTLTSGRINERGDEVVVTDDIVDPGTAPEAASPTVEASEVTAINIGRSRKVTATVVEPSQLVTKRVNERGDVETVTDDVVDPATDPEPNALLVTESHVDAINKGRSRKIVAQVEGHSTLVGQKYDVRTGIATPFTEDIVAAGTVGVPLADIEPRDSARSVQRVYDPATAAMDAYVAKLPVNVDIDLPDVLTGIEVVWEEPVGDGTYSETGSAVQTGDSINLNISRRGSGQGSAGAIPEIIPTFAPKKPGRKRPGVEYYFFMPKNSSRGGILAKLAGADFVNAAVNDWPNFQTKEHTFILRGQNVSAAANANAQASVSVSPSGASYARSHGTGIDQSIGPSIRAVTLRPCIHGTFSLSGGTASTINATVEASADTGLSSSATVSFLMSAVGSVTPTGLSATTPASIPTTGYYLFDLATELFEHGYMIVRALVINAADI